MNKKRRSGFVKVAVELNLQLRNAKAKYWDDIS